MATSNGNRRNLYEVLGVPETASRGDIEKAYVARHAALNPQGQESLDLEEAYLTLSSPQLRRNYDAWLARRGIERHGAPARPEPPRASAPAAAKRAWLEWKGAPRRQWIVLCASCAVLLAILLLVVFPQVSWRLHRYGPGTELINRHDGEPYGTVLRFEPRHSFPNGIVADAYHIRRFDTGKEQWLSRAEVSTLARPR